MGIDFAIEMEEMGSLGKEEAQERDVGLGDEHVNEPLMSRDEDGGANSNAMADSF